jgi:LPS export ABC transporter protein LptC
MIGLKQRLKTTLLVCSLLAWPACSDFDKPSASNADGAPEELPDTESWDAVLHFTKEGKPVAVVHAGYIATYSKKRYKQLSDGVKVDFFDEEGKHKSVLTSNNARVIDDTQDMYAMGKVVVISDEGAKLQTEELMWANAEQKVISNVPVVLKTETETVYGDYFKSDPDLKEYEIVNTRGTSKQTISLDE